MAAFFRSLNTFSSKKEDTIKEAILNTLTENVQYIKQQQQEQQEATGSNCVELGEGTTALCTTLEAFFLHGLKDSLLWQTFQVIAGDEQHRPEPSFWTPLMVFLHKEVIQQIHGLRQITSEIGYCRAWVRLTLNESLFASYLCNMQKQSSVFTPYYKKHALIMDKACLEMAASLMQGLEAHTEFKLPINSSLLNQWPDMALQLSALWTPALKLGPVNAPVTTVAEAEIVEAAEEPAYPTPQPVPTNLAFRDSITSSPFKNVGAPIRTQDILDQIDELLKDNEAQEPHNESESKSEKSKPKPKRLSLTNTLPAVDELSLQDEGARGSAEPGTGSNSLQYYMQTSWKSGDADELDEQPSCSTASTGERKVSRQMSYNSLLTQCKARKPLPLLTPDTEGEETANELAEGQEDKEPNDDDFELVPESNVDQTLLRQLCNIPHESGLDAQGFMCKSCQGPLLGGHGNFKVCGFTGDYHCASCMHLEPVFIPARIIYNWDFNKYTISQRSSAFLKEVADQPLIDLQILNPEIYNAIDAMAELQSLRIRLNFIRAYLYTCSPSSTELLERFFFGRRYLYEEIHMYSVNDLSLILRGTLTQQLHKAFKMGEAHILKCERCSQKGFICEVCKSPRVLYPFHIDTTFRCEECGAVFHPNCVNKNQPCPKCERRRKRRESECDSS